MSVRIYKLILNASYYEVYQELEDIRRWAILNRIECKLGLNWNGGQMLCRLASNEDAVVFFLRFSHWGDYLPDWACDEELLENYPWATLDMMRSYGHEQ